MQTTDTKIVATPLVENVHPAIGKQLSDAISAINRAQKISSDADAEFRRDWERGLDGMISRTEGAR
jgi:hypothetical protein